MRREKAGAIALGFGIWAACLTLSILVIANAITWTLRLT